MTPLRDLIDIPERVPRDDFFLRLAEGIWTRDRDAGRASGPPEGVGITPAITRPVAIA